MAAHDLDLETCSREELVAKILNQRIEIKNLANLNGRAIGRCVELDEQQRKTRKALKGIIYDRC
jgi:predicted ribonuclease YlaK